MNGTSTVGAGAVTFFSKVGLFAQSNLGGSTVPITIFGQPFTAVTPGAVNYGVYGGAGMKVPMSPSSDFSLALNASGQSDGLMTATGKVQFLTKY